MKKPKIRFYGFNDDWEQRKVFDVAEIIAGGTPKTSVLEYWNPKEVPWLSSGEVHKKYITYTDDKISKKGLDHSSAKIIKENSVLIALAGQGKTRGTVAINRIPLSTNQSIAAMIFNDNIVPEFIFSNLDNRYNELRRISSGDGSRGGLNKLLIGNIIIPYTDKLEQDKIGQFFSLLDHLITLHQRKCDEVKKMKKYMLQNMFPQDGEKVPKIRFGGFTDDWEQRKLGDITESYSGGTPTAGKKEYYDGNIPFIRSGEISSDKTELFISEEGLNKSSAKMVKIGDILYALYGATSGEVSISKLKGAINQAILAIQPHQNYDSQFLMQWLRKSKENIIGTYLQGGQGNLSGNIVKELIIDIPTYEEQKEIGAYLKKLDHLITLHQRKCDELKNMKKYMLQNMFV